MPNPLGESVVDSSVNGICERFERVAVKGFLYLAAGKPLGAVITTCALLQQSQSLRPPAWHPPSEPQALQACRGKNLPWQP